jgi:hypothetical protein
MEFNGGGFPQTFIYVVEIIGFTLSPWAYQISSLGSNSLPFGSFALSERRGGKASTGTHEIEKGRFRARA